VANLTSPRAIWQAVRAAEEALGDSGRVLVRASGTEPMVRVMVEAESEEEARRHASAIAEAVAGDARPSSGLTGPGTAPE
jgi:phosphoglucosamine mutase